MRVPLEHQAGLLGHADEVAAPVAPVVMVVLVVHRPEGRIGGHGEHHVAARPRDAAELAQDGEVVGCVLEHVQASHQVEGVVLERQPRDVRGDHLVVPACARRPHGQGADVDSRHVPESGETVEHATRAASGVEDLRAGIETEPPHLAHHDAQTAAVPPVALIMVQDGLELSLLHRPRLARLSLAERLVRLEFG